MAIKKCPVCTSNDTYLVDYYYDAGLHVKKIKVKCKTCGHQWVVIIHV